MSDDDRNAIQAMITAAVQVFTERQDRAVESIATAISELRTELRTEFHTEIDSIRDRLDILAPAVISIDSRMGGFTRALDKLVGAHDDTRQTQAAQ